MPDGGVCGRGLVGLPVQLSSQLLLLLPFCVSQLLIDRQHGVDLAIGVLGDSAAGLVIGLLVAGGICAETVQCDVKAKKDHPEFDHLVLVEVEIFLQRI